MRTDTEIRKDYTPTDRLILEVLMDIRALLVKKNKKQSRKKVSTGG